MRIACVDEPCIIVSHATASFLTCTDCRQLSATQRPAKFFSRLASSFVHDVSLHRVRASLLAVPHSPASKSQYQQPQLCFILFRTEHCSSCSLLSKSPSCHLVHVHCISHPAFSRRGCARPHRALHVATTPVCTAPSQATDAQSIACTVTLSIHCERAHPTQSVNARAKPRPWALREVATRFMAACPHNRHRFSLMDRTRVYKR